MSNLEEIFAQSSAQAFLDYTQSRLALLDNHGSLLAANPAFEKWKQELPSAKRLQDFLSDPSRVLFNWMLQAGGERQARLQQNEQIGKAELKCLVTPQPGGSFLFCAELIQPSMDAEISRLNEELDKTRRTLHLKKVELEAVLAQADEISHTDPLTFLSNRRSIIADLQREVSGANRYRNALTIFMVDVDHFKNINDTYGHAAGDEVLKAISSKMLASIRMSDKLGRYGGEEFLFLLPSTPLKNSTILAERLLNTIRTLEIKVPDGQVIHATISIGIARYRPGKETWEGLLNRADKALYKSKDCGRDRWTAATFN